MKDKLLKDFENLKIENANQVKGGNGVTTKIVWLQTTIHGHACPDKDEVSDLSASTNPGVIPV